MMRAAATLDERDPGTASEHEHSLELTAAGRLAQAREKLPRRQQQDRQRRQGPLTRGAPTRGGPQL